MLSGEPEAGNVKNDPSLIEPVAPWGGYFTADITRRHSRA
jgi:hypothetical protein